jgi:hypothetical protein
MTLTLLAAGALALIGCGGSEPSRPAPGTPGNPLRVTVSQPSVDVAGATGGTSEGAARSGGEPAYQELVERQTRNPKERFTPCNLVTRSEARAILGGPVRRPVEAPQGPTCIYRPKSDASMIALAVQRLDLAKIRPLMRERREITVARRSGVCGMYGQPMLYVPLSGGRVLTVSAPCDVARRFAARALPHLQLV